PGSATVDVKGIITRKEFENLSRKLFDKVTVPCLKALDDSEPTRTLNASECVARGCAIRCAMLSPTLQVRDYEVQDVFPYTIGLLSYEDLPAGLSPKVGHFDMGLSQSAEQVKGRFKFNLGKHGIFDILSISISPPKKTSYMKLKKEEMLAEQDRKMEQLKDQINSLESFVYDTRSKLSNAYKSFATDIEKDRITQSLQETEDWLYEDNDDESDEQVYTAKLGDLKKLLEPIEKRYKDGNEKQKGKRKRNPNLIKTVVDKRLTRSEARQATY
ncbi:heat shock 70 kDa protein 16-like protein, partial [Tanacetum coccineum]